MALRIATNVVNARAAALPSNSAVSNILLGRNTSPVNVRPMQNLIGVGGVQKSGVAGQLDIDRAGIGETVTQVGNVACAMIPNAALRLACIAATGAIGSTITGKETEKAGNIAPNRNTDPYYAETERFVAQQVPKSCPPGTVQVPGTNTCVSPGDAFPGGAPLTFPAGGPTGSGMMGMPAYQPAMYSQTHLRCPRRYILAIDNLCYPKGFVPRSLRKWVPSARPLLSAMDGKILNRAKSVQKKLKRVAGKHVPKARGCPPRKGK